MSEDCVFCKIVAKQAAASVVYEDEKVIAFLSNRPVNEGHTLVVPKAHYVDIYDVPEDVLVYLFRVVKKLSGAVRDGMEAEGIRIVQNNGWAAGQVIFHYHVHIIPLKAHEGFLQDVAYRKPSNGRLPEALEIDAEKIRRQLEK